MPKKSDRPGWRLLFLQLPEDLDDALRARCAVIGAKIADEVRLALRRHLAYPPPAPVIPPLPNGEPEAKPKRGRPRKEKLS